MLPDDDSLGSPRGLKNNAGAQLTTIEKIEVNLAVPCLTLRYLLL
jgi:hypothetical protein